ncbi:MAG: MSHA biogenesis protein MshP [Parashewanella sp.]
MSPNTSITSISSLKRQQGSLLVLGIFVLTVMFLLAASLITVSDQEDTALSQEIWGTRALLAANSGADAALARLFPPNAAPASNCDPINNAPINKSWTPPTINSFRGCRVTLECTMFEDPTQTPTPQQYRITSKAICELGNLRVSRQVEVMAKD